MLNSVIGLTRQNVQEEKILIRISPSEPWFWRPFLRCGSRSWFWSLGMEPILGA